MSHAPDRFDRERFLQYTPAVTSVVRIDIANDMAYMDGTHGSIYAVALK